MTTDNEKSKVLIADDSVILNNLLRDVFEHHGFQVYQAFDGPDCMSLFVEVAPDVSFIDIQMPKIDGVEVLRFIKEREPEAIVVMMTGTGTEDTALRSLKMGADDYLRKPFSTADVVDVTKRLLHRRDTERETRRLKNRIRNVEKYLAHLTTAISEALITTDVDGGIEFSNLAARNLWGYSSDELNGRNVHFLVKHEASSLPQRDLVTETIRNGSIKGEFHFRMKDGGTFPGYLSTSVIRDRNGIRGVVMVVTDLTKLREMESRLKQTEKLASLGKVVEGVAHEVRNCLTSLGGFTLRLQKMTAEIPRCMEYTHIMLADVACLEQMVHEIEEYARFSKSHSLNFEEVDLVAILEESHSRALDELPPDWSKAVTFQLNADSELPVIQADSQALEQVFFNLILNAYEAMPNGGALTVDLKIAEDSVSVVFIDTGVGIHREELVEIFNPFVTSKTSGAGMGLSKAYLLVEEHGGSIDVSSEPGRGTSFSVSLPLSHGPKAR
jgi:PAS domain S-box-containing protein